MKEPGTRNHKQVDKAQKRGKLAEEVQLFVKQYGRKAQKGLEPNDRRYDGKIETRVKQMHPEDLDRLLRDGEE